MRRRETTLNSLTTVYRDLKERLGKEPAGVYMAHDSMGVARYGGRGNIFHRLMAHERKYRRELVYY